MGVCAERYIIEQQAVVAACVKSHNEKPVAAVEKLIAANVCETVMDPFMGSGTTLLAAKLCGSGPSVSRLTRSIAKQRWRGWHNRCCPLPYNATVRRHERKTNDDRERFNECSPSRRCYAASRHRLLPDCRVVRLVCPAFGCVVDIVPANDGGVDTGGGSDRAGASYRISGAVRLAA